MRWIGIVVSATLLTACQAPGTEPAPTPTPADVTSSALTKRVAVINILRTGGFAGVEDRIAVDAQGHWTYSTRGQSPRGGRLTSDEIDRLNGLATDQRLAAEALRTQAPSRCADAFNYEVTVDAVAIRYSDCPSDPDQPVVAKQIVQTLNDIV